MKHLIPGLLALLTFLSPALAHEGHEHDHSENPVATEMITAANSLLGILNDEQKKAAQFEFKADERENWHYVPLDRKGLRLDTTGIEVQHLARALLATSLSHKGYLTASQIMSLEHYLAQFNDTPDYRNPGKYYVSIFGKPAAKGTWGWRYEGHHLSINLTLVNGVVQDTPTFFGTNPGEIKDGPRKGMRPLGEAEDAARALATEFHQAGHPVVFSDKAPEEILTGQDRSAKTLEKQGLASATLSAAERKKLLHLIEVIYSYQRAETGAAELKKLHLQHAKNITFAWAGSLERGKAHYFRLQSPDILIEYANTQNDANHAHLVLRHLKDDFGRDLLKEHYQDGHKH
ncbi:MAG: DUF3500 domain-containing protein [Verrucomicrobiales bacterium]